MFAFGKVRLNGLSSGVAEWCTMRVQFRR